MRTRLTRWSLALIAPTIAALCIASLCAAHDTGKTDRTQPADAVPPAASKTEPLVIPITEGLAIRDVVEGGRVPFPRDAVAQLIIDGTFAAPKAGDVVTGLDGQPRTWEAVKADTQGQFAPEVGRRGYLFATVPSDRDRVMLLHTVGNAMTYMNGEPRVGDPYACGFVRVPVMLKKGDNAFLLAMAGRGPMRATLTEATHEVMLNTGDVTLPDVVIEKPRADGSAVQVENTLHAGVVVINATDAPMPFVLHAECLDGESSLSHTFTGVDALAPLSVRKVPFTLVTPSRITGERVRYRLGVRPLSGGPMHEAEIALRVRTMHQTHKVAFVSHIDRSVQYYGVTPPVEGTLNKDRRAPSLVLSLHGAGVEAIGQAEAYSPKPNMYIVCPTNRRPFGFDWEDWGAQDALEVLAHAQSRFKTDERRTYLTGHSMGGHGTWNLAVNNPHLFAAIAPSAGWLSFNTYAAARGPGATEPPAARSPVPDDAPIDERLADLFRRSAASSDTIAMLENLRGKGIYILHGDADDNVPVSEARRAKDELTKLGIPFEYHEQPGAGHWWDDDQPGAACVDWPPVFAMFERHELPDPAKLTEDRVVATIGYGFGQAALLLMQQRVGILSALSLKIERETNTIDITTRNAHTVCIDGSVVEERASVQIRIDGQHVATGRLSDHEAFERLDGQWVDSVKAIRSRPVTQPSKCRDMLPRGPLKAAFSRGVSLVYPATRVDDVSRAAFSKARYDAEQWWYRGNGGVRLATDSDAAAFLRESEMSGNLVLYGPPSCNGAWSDIWPDRPRIAPGGKGIVTWTPSGVVLSESAVQAKTRTTRGPALVMTVYPFLSDDLAYMATAIAATDARAMRATFRIPYFVSGVGYPDLTVFTPDVAREGVKAVQGAGFFGHDWTIEAGEFVWREQAK